jgi:hypothetical protein
MTARALLVAGVLALTSACAGGSGRVVVTKGPLRVVSYEMDVEWKPRYGAPRRVPALFLGDEGVARDPETGEPLTAGLGAGIVRW